MSANPLYTFRAPHGMVHPSIEGGHFQTKRADVVNDTGVFNIYPGSFRYMPDPTLEIDLAIWEDTPDPKSKANYYNLTMREGYELCKFDEWEILDAATALVWQKDVAGRIVFGTPSSNATSTLVLAFRTGEEAEEAARRRVGQAAQVSMSPEEMQAAMNDKLGPLGASVEVTLEDDDAPDRSSRTRKRR